MKILGRNLKTERMGKISGRRNTDSAISFLLFVFVLVERRAGCHGQRSENNELSTPGWSLFWTINGVEHCWAPENMFLYPGTSIKPIPAADCCNIMRYHPHPIHQSNWMETVTTTGLCFSTKYETTNQERLKITLDTDCSTHSFYGRHDGKMALIENSKYCMDFRDGYNILSECSETIYLPEGKDCSSGTLLVSYRVSIPIKPSIFIQVTHSMFQYTDRTILRSLSTTMMNTTVSKTSKSDHVIHVSKKEKEKTSYYWLSTDDRYFTHLSSHLVHSSVNRQKSINRQLFDQPNSSNAIFNYSGSSVQQYLNKIQHTTKYNKDGSLKTTNVMQLQDRSNRPSIKTSFKTVSKDKIIPLKSSSISVIKIKQLTQQSNSIKCITKPIHRSKSSMDNKAKLNNQPISSRFTIDQEKTEKIVATTSYKMTTISRRKSITHLTNESKPDKYIHLSTSSMSYLGQPSNISTVNVSRQHSGTTYRLPTYSNFKVSSNTIKIQQVSSNMTKIINHLQYTYRKPNQTEWYYVNMSVSQKAMDSSSSIRNNYFTTQNNLKSVTDVDAKLSLWAPWSNCLTTCGTGVQKRFRQNCTKFKPCNRLEKETKSCSVKPCPIDGGLSQWSNWSTCSNPCEQGVMVRKRSCTQPVPKFGGADCLGITKENEICNTHLCPINGGWTTWSPFTKCNKPCNNGQIKRMRFCTNPTPANNGRECEGGEIQTKLCNKRLCSGLTSKLVLILAQNEWGISNKNISTEKYKRIEESVSQNIKEFYNFPNIYSNDSNVTVLQDILVDEISSSNNTIEVSVFLEFTALDSGQLILLLDEMEQYHQIEKLSVLDFHFTTQYVPQGIPFDLSGYSMSTTEIFIKWDVPDKQKNLTYVVFYKKRDKSALSYCSIGMSCCNATLIGLHPSQSYWLRVLAYNPHGNGIPSNHIEITTTIGAPSLPPHNVDATTQGTSLYIEWDIHQSEKDRVSGYSLQIKQMDINLTMEYKTTQRQFLLEGMRPSTHYIIDICAFTRIICGPRARITAKTKTSGPTMAPLNITAVPVLGVASLLLMWRQIPESEINGELSHYMISYTKYSSELDKTDHPTQAINVSSLSNSTVIRNLEMYQMYQISMWGVNQYSYGVKSNFIIASTDKCPSQIHTNYVNLHPYVCAGEKYQCLFVELLQNFTREICSKVLVNNNKILDIVINGKGGWAAKSDILLMKKDLSQDVDVSFPVNANKEVLNYGQGHFIPVIEHPGVVVITAKEETAQVIQRMLSAILACWPIFAFNVLLIISAGIIIWFIESGENNQEFPPQFVQGAFNGMWWAFVTSVTLGYGDKCPITFWGRAFGMVWTIIGIILVTTLTGLLTSALTAYNIKTSFNLYGKKVGTLTGSIGYKIAVRRNAKVNENHHQYLTISELIQALETKEVDHILVDAFAAKSNKKVLTNKSFLVSKVIEERSMYGFVISARLGAFSLALKEYVKSNQGAIYRSLEAYSTPIKVHQETTQVVSLFDNKISSYKKSIQAMGLILLFATAVGVICLVKRRQHSQKIHPRISCSKLKLYNDLKMLHNEINSTKAALEAGISKIINDYMQYGKIPLRHKDVYLKQKELLKAPIKKVKINEGNTSSMAIDIPDDFFFLSSQKNPECKQKQWDTVPRWFLMNKNDIKKYGYRS